jgi:hypothetical protein
MEYLVLMPLETLFWWYLVVWMLICSIKLCDDIAILLGYYDYCRTILLFYDYIKLMTDGTLGR